MQRQLPNSLQVLGEELSLFIQHLLLSMLQYLLQPAVTISEQHLVTKPATATSQDFNHTVDTVASSHNTAMPPA